MKRLNLPLVLALSMSVAALSAPPAKHKKGAAKNAGSGFAARTKVVAAKDAPSRFSEIISVLGEEKDGKPLAIWCGNGYLHENDNASKLKGQFETLLKYRQGLNACNDDLSKQVKIFLDEYIDTIVLENQRDKFGKTLADIENPGKNLAGIDSALRYHEVLKDFLKEKAEKLSDNKDSFEKADTAVVTALDSIFNVCVPKEFKPSKDAKTTQKIDEFKAQVQKVTKDGFKAEHACALEVEDPAAPVIDEEENGSTINDDSEATPEHTDAPPRDEKPGDPSAGTGALPPGGPQGQVLPPPPLAQQVAPNNFSQFDPNAAQLQELSDREADALRGQAELLQQALNEATRPNRVGGDNSRSFQFPPVSVSPQPGNQSQQQPQQQQQPYPPMQIPPFQPMPIPAAAPISPELLSSLARSNSTPRVDPNAAAASQAMMEMARMQQQLMQAQLANQMNMNNQGLNRNSNRIRGQAAFRGTRGRAGNRFMSRGRRVMSRNMSGAQLSSRIGR